MVLLLPLLGVSIVLLAILGLRMHAFLALLLAALVVAWLTPTSSREAHELRKSAVPIVSIKGDELRLDFTKHNPDAIYLLVEVDPEENVVRPLADVEVSPPLPRMSHFVLARIVYGRELETGRGVPKGPRVAENELLVVPQEAVAAAAKLRNQHPAERVAIEFGKLCGSIGILIALAAIVGRCLLESGSADRIIRSTIGLLGESRASQALAVSGFILGIPVFFDTVFYLMIPLAKALREQGRGNYLLSVLSIVCGATMTHSLVPPTPGPLFAAQGLGVSLGTMIIAGCLVGAVTSTVGYLYALWITRNWDLARPEEDKTIPAPPGEAELKSEADLPPLALALMPIVLPVFLIALATAFDAWKNAPEFLPELRLAPAWNQVNYAVQFIGQKDLAMSLAAAAAMITLVWQRSMGGSELTKVVQSELGEAGTVILITSAGGALGGVLQQTGVAHELAGVTQGFSGLWILTIAFAVTVAVRTMQGSATVAMVTAVGIFAPFADPAKLGFHPVYLALAIGCGSKPFSWMADSGFWVISRMGGLTEWETLQTVTVQLALMGFTGLGVVLLAAWLWPMV